MRSAYGFILASLVAACAQHSAYQQGLELFDQGKMEAGLAKLAEAARLEPNNREIRQSYFRQRDVALQRYLTEAEGARLQGQWDKAEEAYRRMVAIDPENRRARTGLAAVEQARRQRADLASAEALLAKGDAAAAATRVRAVLSESPGNREAQQLQRRIEETAVRASVAGPQLSAAVREPITLEFRDTTLRNLFDAISRSTGLNFVFDRDVRPDARTTIFVRNTPIEEVLRFVLVTNQLEKKVLSDNTLLVYPNTPQKLRDYQELVVKTFYLANADAKTTAALIQKLVKTKDLHIDEKLNLIIMRDTPDAVRMAERLVASQDLSESEVMLEVEVLEVGSNVLNDVGIGWPNSLSVSIVGAAGTPGTITLRELQNRNSDLVRLAFTDPLFALNFRNQLSRSNLLANPRIRVRNKDKAKVHIGDKVPVITTTTTATGFASESVTYLDVGLKLEVEPTISLDDEVGIKVGLEVSNIAREIRNATGTLTYQVGTRNAATTLRLRDGETQILAGLISDEERKSVNQIPGLGDLPIAGRLFGTHLDTANKTEIVLLITPRIVRNLTRPEAHISEFLSGTEAAAGAPPLILQRTTAKAPPPVAAATTQPGFMPGKATARISLSAPAGIPVDQEFQLVVSLETENAIRAGLLDFAFDPSRLKFVRVESGALLSAADKEAPLRAKAAQGLGRLELSFSSKADLAGKGELARITFLIVGTSAAPPIVRLEALSLSDAAGLVVPAQPPPALRLSITR